MCMYLYSASCSLYPYQGVLFTEVNALRTTVNASFTVVSATFCIDTRAILHPIKPASSVFRQGPLTSQY